MKVLLVDTSFSSMPIYEYLVKNGIEVYIIGNNRNDFMAKNLSNFIFKDYSDPVVLESVVIKLGIDFVIPGCNDSSYLACSLLSDKSIKRNIDTTENVEILTNKLKFRKYAKQHSLPVPEVYSLNSILIESEINELIVKPVDSYSGKGVSRVNEKNKKDILSLILYAQSFSKETKYVIEEFVEGDLYSHSAFIENGKIVKDFIVSEYCSTNPYVVDTSYVCFDFSESILNRIRMDIEKLVFMLKLSDGLMHTQFILKEKKYWLIEITRRCPGDLYSELIELSTGYQYAAKYASYFIGSNISNDLDKYKKNQVIRHTVTQRGSGVYYSLDGKDNFNIIKEVNLVVAGDYLEASPKGRVKILFIKSRSEKEKINIKNKILLDELYEIKFIN